jgi:hypothetical protein
VPGKLARDRCAESTIGEEPAWLRASTPLVSPSMSEPRLVAAVRLSVACDLSIHALVALADPSRDRLDRLARRQAVGDLDAVVLAQIATADGPVDEAHAASVDEPQRPAARRHADR